MATYIETIQDVPVVLHDVDVKGQSDWFCTECAWTGRSRWAASVHQTETSAAVEWGSDCLSLQIPIPTTHRQEKTS